MLYFLTTELTIRIVDVPIKVQLPPKIPAKDTGKSNFPLGILYFLDKSVIILMNTITTAVVLINPDTAPVMNINKGIINRRGSIFNFSRPLDNHEITPLSSNPIAIIIKQRMDIVAGLENPLIASSGSKRTKTLRLTLS